jgi:hypothetical protein
MRPSTRCAVFDGDVAVAWCENSIPEELPNIYHRKEYVANLDRLPGYRRHPALPALPRRTRVRPAHRPPALPAPHHRQP